MITVFTFLLGTGDALNNPCSHQVDLSSSVSQKESDQHLLNIQHINFPQPPSKVKTTSQCWSYSDAIIPPKTLQPKLCVPYPAQNTQTHPGVSCHPEYPIRLCSEQLPALPVVTESYVYSSGSYQEFETDESNLNAPTFQESISSTDLFKSVPVDQISHTSVTCTNQHNIIASAVGIVTTEPPRSVLSHSALATSTNFLGNDYCVPQSAYNNVVPSYVAPTFFLSQPSPSVVQTTKQIAAPSLKRIRLDSQSDLLMSHDISAQRVQHTRPYCSELSTTLLRPSFHIQPTEPPFSRGTVKVSSDQDVLVHITQTTTRNSIVSTNHCFSTSTPQQISQPMSASTSTKLFYMRQVMSTCCVSQSISPSSLVHSSSHLSQEQNRCLPLTKQPFLLGETVLTDSNLRKSSKRLQPCTHASTVPASPSAERSDELQSKRIYLPESKVAYGEEGNFYATPTLFSDLPNQASPLSKRIRLNSFADSSLKGCELPSVQYTWPHCSDSGSGTLGLAKQHSESQEVRGTMNLSSDQCIDLPETLHSQLPTLPAISLETFELVYSTLYSVRSKWYEFGLALGLLTDTLDSIAVDESHKTEGCLRRMLCKRMKMKQLTWDEVVAALRRPAVNRNDLAEKIEKGDLNYLNKAGAVYDLSGEPTLKELCALPVENVWYQLGLWLGIEEGVLEKLKKNQSADKLEEMFSAFLDLPLGTAQYEDLVEELSNKQYRKAEPLLKQHDYDEFVDLFPIEKKATAQEIVDERKAPKYPRLVMALVKVGQRKIAEEVCSKKGMSIT